MVLLSFPHSFYRALSKAHLFMSEIYIYINADNLNAFSGYNIVQVTIDLNYHWNIHTTQKHFHLCCLSSNILLFIFMHISIVVVRVSQVRLHRTHHYSLTLCSPVQVYLNWQMDEVFFGKVYDLCRIYHIYKIKFRGKDSSIQVNNKNFPFAENE